MKKLVLFILFMLASLGLWAQSKTTGSVNLVTGMTAELVLNNSTTTATLTLTGPSDRWFALQFGIFPGTSGGGMASGQDLVYYNGTTLVDAVHNGVGATPSNDAVNNWTVTSNTVSGSTRTIIATRAFNTGDANDHTFVYSNANIDFAYARSQSASYALANHGPNRGYQLNRPFTCIPPAAPTALAQTFCGSATVANLVATGATGATFSWYTAPTGGTALASSAPVSTGTYYVSQTVDACESTRTSVSIAIATATAQDLPDVTACDSYTLAALAAGNNYYTGTGGTGTMLTAGTIITTTQLIYIYTQTGTTPNCTDQNSFTVTINTTPNAVAPDDQSVCNEYELPALTVGNYYTGPGGTGTMLMEGDVVTATQLIYIYAESGTTPNCSAEDSFTVTIINTTSPVADAAQEFCEGATVLNLIANGAVGATLSWYDVPTGGTALADTEVLTSGSYYVEQMLDGCTSGRTEVVVTIGPLSNPIAEDQAFCGEVILGAVEVTTVGNQGFLIPVWYDMATGGTPLDANMTITASGIYYVSQSNGFCESEREEVNITINAIPTAPVGDSEQEFTPGETVEDLEIAVEGGVIITWYIMNAGMQLVEIETSTALVDGGEYYVTQTVDGCESEPFMVTANEALSIEGITKNNIILYPNPVTDVLIISGQTTVAKVAVVNLLGQNVINQEANNDEVIVNMESLGAGTYFVQVYAPNGAMTSFKVIKK
ncbi:T9SS type A sorting domain-containing protein [Flavobacterium salilacus subsp. salilacus]|uniref:Ig-like domain-containing protein n=1 Tax=Flavobacterium TaxID=237 RepID=UPI0010750D05|nr:MULTISPECIES: T9SS type A sorting domain-containing protein [Flavobacterium]KAF2515824.1 T9SS type A sorting domain-containing protein [Flavobacterium salilacus subsp. salilacus]MBE1615372.1 T9SS type A sorting domain-containing protein [Flavobacterium sp. SaA2.13]